MSEINLFDVNDVTSSNRYLHTPSEFARKNLIYVQEVGRLKSLKPHACRRRELESYLFFIVINGCGQVTTGGKTYDLKAGDCAFIDCRVLYEHRSDEKNPWELMWVHMNGGVLPEFYSMFADKNDKSPVFKAVNIKKYTDYIEKMMACQDDKDITSEFISNSMLTELVTRIMVEIINEGNKNLNPDILNSIREVVNSRYKEDNLLESICNEYNIEEIAINNQFKEKFGIDLCDYILNRRFACAKELLRFSVKSVKEIIVESGIVNSDLFRHLFIENEGMTAEEYRMKWAQWNRG